MHLPSVHVFTTSYQRVSANGIKHKNTIRVNIKPLDVTVDSRLITFAIQTYSNPLNSAVTVLKSYLTIKLYCVFLPFRVDAPTAYIASMMTYTGGTGHARADQLRPSDRQLRSVYLVLARLVIYTLAVGPDLHWCSTQFVTFQVKSNSTWPTMMGWIHYFAVSDST